MNFWLVLFSVHILFTRKLSYQFFRSCSNLGSFNILKITDLSSKVITVFAFNTPDVLKWSNTNACQAVSNIEVPVNVFRFVFIVCDDDFPQEQFLITTPSVNDQSPCETFYLKQVKLNILLKWLQGSNLSQTFSLFWNRNHWWPWLATGTRLHIFLLSRKWKFFI